ncbi:hypothetical protein OSTOST_20681 [Ostertagia ostertagi]
MCHEVTGRRFEELDNATQTLLKEEFKEKTFVRVLTNDPKDYVQSYQLFTRDCLTRQTHFVNGVFHRRNNHTLTAYVITVRNGTERGFSKLRPNGFYGNLYKDNCDELTYLSS